jgi:hypothetical protein
MGCAPSVGCRHAPQHRDGGGRRHRLYRPWGHVSAIGGVRAVNLKLRWQRIVGPVGPFGLPIVVIVLASLVVSGLVVLAVLYPNNETDVTIDDSTYCVVVEHGASRLLPAMRDQARQELVVVDLRTPAQPVFRSQGFAADRFVTLVTEQGRVQSTFTLPAGSDAVFFREPVMPVRYVVVARDHTLNTPWPPRRVQVGGSHACPRPVVADVGRPVRGG